MKSDELPLLELFTRLRQAGLPLGVNEYQLVLQALQSGFGIPDRQALARLCCSLWIKSAEDKLLFDYHFEEVMAEDMQQVRAADKAMALTPAIESPKNPVIAVWRTISLPTRWAVGGLLVLVTGIALWSIRPICPYFTSKPQEFIEEGKKYRYEIKACTENPTDRVEITALKTRPWLKLEDKHNGTAILSGVVTDYLYIAYYSTRLWNLQGKPITIFGNVNIRDIRFSSNGQHLVTELDNGTARLWDIHGKQLTDFGNITIGDSRDDFGIIFSPSGQHLTTELDDGTARLWDIKGKQLTDFGNIKIINSRDNPGIVFSPNGQHLTTELDDGTARLWDIKGKQLTDFGNIKIINSRDNPGIVFSPNGQYFITRLNDNTARLWDVKGKQLTDFGNIKIINSRNNPGIIFSPNGQYFITRLNDNTARLWDIRGKPLNIFGDLKISTISFSPNGQHLVTELDNGTARLWDFQGKQLTNFENLKISRIIFSPSGRHLVTELDDGTVRIWGFQEKKLTIFGNFKTGLSKFNSEIIFSPDGQHLIIRFYNQTASLWDLPGKQLTEFGSLKISRIIFSPNGRHLVTALDDGTVRIWGFQEKKLTDFGSLKTDKFISNFGIGFSPDGQHLVTELDDGTNRLWDLHGKQLTDFGNLKNSRVFFNPDGQSLTTITTDSEVKLQVTDPTTGKSDIQTFNLTKLDSSEFQKKFVYWLIIFGFISGSLVALLLPIGYVIARSITQCIAKPPVFPPMPQPDEGTSTSSALKQELQDEVQVAQAIHQGNRSTTDIFLSSFTESSEFFPVTSRQMKQSWRYLRRFVREGPLVELDLEATVQQMSCQGMLLRPVMKPRRVNRNELLLLVDRDGSMVPFHTLSERLAETAMLGGRLGKAGIYYFHNCPGKHLYHDPYHQVAEPIDEILAKLHSEYTGILIFSDAGAARGTFSRERLDMTAEFLAQLRQKLRHIVWLNPLPRDRWTGSAAEIAKIVPMFELSRRGLNQAIDVLRGKSPVETGGKL